MHLRFQTISCHENVELRKFNKEMPESALSLSGELASIDSEKVFIDEDFVIGDSRYLKLRAEATKREQVIPSFNIGRHSEETMKEVLDNKSFKEAIGYLWVNVSQARDDITSEKLDFNECRCSFQIFVNEQHFAELREVLLGDRLPKELCFEVGHSRPSDSAGEEEGCLTFGTLPDEMVLKTAKKREGRSRSYTEIPVTSISIINTRYKINESAFQLSRRLKEAAEGDTEDAATSKEDKIIALLRKQTERLERTNLILVLLGVLALITLFLAG